MQNDAVPTVHFRREYQRFDRIAGAEPEIIRHRRDEVLRIAVPHAERQNVRLRLPADGFQDVATGPRVVGQALRSSPCRPL